jgi:hypothetical protein
MTITVLSRWTGELEDIRRFGGKVKPIYQKHGARFDVSQIFSGTYTGHFLMRISYPDWERLGRTMYALSKDAEYQEALAEAQQVGEMHACSVSVGLELSDLTQDEAEPGLLSATTPNRARVAHRG